MAHREKILRLILGDQLNAAHSWTGRSRPARTGISTPKTACPTTAAFRSRHRVQLDSNPRIGMMYRTWDRMASPDKKRILKQAEVYRKELNRL